MNMRNTGELLPDREVVQVFRTDDGQLSIISLVIATFGRPNIGSLTLSLHRMERHYAPPPESPPAARFSNWTRPVSSHRRRFGLPLRKMQCGEEEMQFGEEVAVMTIPCSELLDFEFLDFRVGPLMTVRGEVFALRIHAHGTVHEAAPTLPITDEGERIAGHVACFIAGKLERDFGIVANLSYGGLIAESAVPRMILYSPVTQCNLNCIHCISAHTRVNVNRLPETIKTEMRHWAASGELEMISSDYSGDILWADSRFGGELDFLFSLGVPFHIDTNGVCLTAEVSERLCRENIASLNISLDTAEEHTYKRVRKGSLPLRMIVANIEGFMRVRAETRVDCPVSISFTLMRSNLSEWADFVRLGARLGVDTVISRHLEAFTPEMEEDSLWHDQADFNAAREEVIALAETLGIEVTTPPPFAGVTRTGRRICAEPWNSAVILGNGDVAACCVPGLVMGNLNNASMQEIWNGKRYRDLRATVNSAAPPPTCAACPMLRHTDNPDSYLIHSALRRMNA